MKILLIHHRLPYPLHSGMDKVRFNLIKTLHKEHQVDIIFPYDYESEIKIPEELSKFCNTIISIPVKLTYLKIKSEKRFYLKRMWTQLIKRIPNYISNDYQPELAKKIEEITSNNDYQIVQTLSDVTGKYQQNIKGKAIKIAGPMDDTLSSAWTNMIAENKWRKKIGWYIEYLARKKWQPALCAKVDLAFFFSINDLNKIKKYCKNCKLEVLPAIIEEKEDWDPESPQKTEPDSVIFIGGLGSYFNKHAVIFFAKEVLPHIIKQNPEVKFIVVGQSPDKEILSLKNKNVNITGKVDDIRQYIEKASVYVSPIYAGSGFKTKIVEALRFGKPVISTEKGVQGLADLGNNTIVIENKPEPFAEKVIKLLKDDNIRIQYAYRSRKLFEKSYSSKVIAPKILDIYSRISI